MLAELQQRIAARRPAPTGAEDALEMALIRRQQSAKEFELHAARAAGAARRKAAVDHDTKPGVAATLQRDRTVTSTQTLDTLESALTIQLKALKPVTLSATTSASRSSGGNALAAQGASSLPPIDDVGAVADTAAADAFAEFLNATDAASALAAHGALLASVESERSLQRLAAKLKPVLPHRAKQLLISLEARAAKPQYRAPKGHGSGRASLSAVVIGGGPVGLRTAIELALLGVRVEVLEARRSFSRLQVLHLWEVKLMRASHTRPSSLRARGLASHSSG